MPLTGTDSVLAGKLKSSIQSKLEAKLGKSTEKQEFLQAICEGIAEVLVPHLVSMIMVAPGIPVATAGGPASQVGATTGPGTIT